MEPYQSHLNWGQANSLYSTRGSSSEVPPAPKVYKRLRVPFPVLPPALRLWARPALASLFLPIQCRSGVGCSMRTLLWSVHSSQAAHYSLDVSKHIKWRSPSFSAKQTKRESSLRPSLAFCSQCARFLSTSPFRKDEAEITAGHCCWSAVETCSGPCLGMMKVITSSGALPSEAPRDLSVTSQQQ